MTKRALAALDSPTLTEGSTKVGLLVPFPFTKSGVQTVYTGTYRFYIDGDFVVSKVRIGVGTAPTGASLIVDVNKNGTTIFTTQSRRPTISASAFTALNTSTIENGTLTTADYLTIDIDQIGSTIAGSDLVVIVWLQRV